MAKDSQIDKKGVREQKANNQTPLTQESANKSKNDKKQSAEHNHV